MMAAYRKIWQANAKAEYAMAAWVAHTTTVKYQIEELNQSILKKRN